jgi:hypothetical protein
MSVDMKEAAPVRPGTPSFGRPEGVSSLAVKAPTLTSSFETTARRSAGIQSEVLDWRSKEQSQAAIAARMSDSFFMKNRTAAEPVAPSAKEEFTMPMIAQNFNPGMNREVKSNPAGFKTDEVGSFRATGASSSVRPSDVFVVQDSGQEELQQPDGLFPKGSFINRTA